MGITAVETVLTNVGNLHITEKSMKNFEKLRKKIYVNLKNNLNSIFFYLNYIFNKSTNQSKKCVFENIWDNDKKRCA